MGNIVWLASYPKSGNTWMRAFLANLVADCGRPLYPDELRNYADGEMRAQRYSQLAGRPSTELSPVEIAELRPRVHALIAQQAQGTRLVKSHNMAGTFEGFPLYNWQVSAGAIYVVRNPLDVAVSMSHHFGLTIDEAIERLGNENVATINEAGFVTEILGSWSMHVEGWANVAARAGGKVLVFRYEDLLDKPLKQFAKAAKLIALGQDMSRIERAVGHSSFQMLAALERDKGFVEAVDEKTVFFRKGRANQWREALSRDQIARVVSDHRGQMARFEYVPPGF